MCPIEDEIESSEVPNSEVTTSSNPEDTDDVMSPEGWKPEPDDDNPVITVTFDEPESVMDVTAETKNVKKFVIKVTDGDDVVFEEPVEVKYSLKFV